MKKAIAGSALLLIILSSCGGHNDGGNKEGTFNDTSHVATSNDTSMMQHADSNKIMPVDSMKK